MRRRVRCKAGHTILVLSERARRTPSGLCKIERLTENRVTSLETMLNTEACNPEALSLIGRKSLKSWISDRGDLSESGDSGESVPGNSESNGLGHLITSIP